MTEEEEIHKEMKHHLATFPKRQERVEEMYRVIFGDQKTGEKGMNDKINEMYEVFVVGKSGTTFIKWIGAFLIAIGVIISAIKGLK